ncbi:MAG: hypothetical protein RLZZ224_765 [Verrucomicrobiota bacterium]|jgi:hypothetical protein
MGRFHGILLAEDVGGTGLRSGSLLAHELIKFAATRTTRRKKCFIGERGKKQNGKETKGIRWLLSGGNSEDHAIADLQRSACGHAVAVDFRNGLGWLDGSGVNAADQNAIAFDE